MLADWSFAAPERPTFAFLVIDDGGAGILLAGLDEDRAHEFARNTGSVVVKLPVTADFRKDG